MGKVKITGGLNPRGFKVTVDGEEIHGILSLDISARPDQLTTATMEVLVDEVDIELATSGVTVEPIAHG